MKLPIWTLHGVPGWDSLQGKSKSYEYGLMDKYPELADFATGVYFDGPPWFRGEQPTMPGLRNHCEAAMETGLTVIPCFGIGDDEGPGCIGDYFDSEYIAQAVSGITGFARGVGCEEYGLNPEWYSPNENSPGAKYIQQPLNEADWRGMAQACARSTARHGRIPWVLCGNRIAPNEDEDSTGSYQSAVRFLGVRCLDQAFYTERDPAKDMGNRITNPPTTWCVWIGEPPTYWTTDEFCKAYKADFSDRIVAKYPSIDRIVIGMGMDAPDRIEELRKGLA